MPKRRLTRRQKESKWRKQRESRGFDDCEVWGLCAHLAEHIYPRLRAFRKMGVQSYPGTLTAKKWERILDDMAEGFRLYLREENGVHPFKKAEYIRDQKKIAHGLKLFGEWFGHLWN